MEKRACRACSSLLEKFFPGRMPSKGMVCTLLPGWKEIDDPDKHFCDIGQDRMAAAENWRQAQQSFVIPETSES